MKKIYLAISACVLIALNSSPLSANDDPLDSFRTWKDRSGKHEIEAQLVDSANSQVRLKKPDGTLISVPLKSLSNADKWFVRNELRRRKANPSNAKTPNDIRNQPKNKLLKDKAEPDRKASDLAKRIDTKKLFGIQWHQNRDSAELAAKQNPKQPKPIMWFRVLGDLEGFM